MVNPKQWFAIINPTSGNGSSKHKWPTIQQLLKTYGFKFDFAFTEHENHGFELVQEAIKNGIQNIICIGGDGTLHDIVNGIMNQDSVPSKDIIVGMIPIGTGNDWVKTHRIQYDVEKAIQIIKNDHIKTQDIGKIELIAQDKKTVYFNNLAGIGYDGFVVSKVHKYKHFGAAAYTFGAVLGLFCFKNFKSIVQVNEHKIDSKNLMILAGLCTYSGGGMQLTKDADPFDGLLDITIVKNISKLGVIANLGKMFNGKIANHKKVETFKSETISVSVTDKHLPYIQADGELIGKGNIKISIVPKAFSFYGN